MEKSIYYYDNENKQMRTIEITHMLEIMDYPIRLTENVDLTEFVKLEKSIVFENNCVFLKEKVFVPESEFKHAITLLDMKNAFGSMALGIRQNSKTNYNSKNDQLEFLALKIEDLIDEFIDICKN